MRPLVKLVAALGIGAAAVAVTLFIGAYTFLPSLVEVAVARNLQSNLGLSQTPEVDLTADPAYEMLAGRFDSGEVALEEPEFAGVRPERVRVDLDGFTFEPVASVRERSLSTQGPLSGNIRVVLSEGELERIAGTGVDSFPVRGIGISGGDLAVESATQVLGLSVPISVRGPVGVEGGEIVFEPDEASAFETSLPQNVTDQILSGTRFGYPIEDLPFDGEITAVETGEGTLSLEGSVRDLPVS